MTNGEWLRAEADRIGIPLRTLPEVVRSLDAAAEKGSEGRMARLMLKHGRLTPEAQTYVEQVARRY